MVNREADTARTFEAILIRQCAPTLAGLKLGSLFCFRHRSQEFSRQKARQWDQRLSSRGLTVRILLERPAAHSALVYVYRRNRLEGLLAEPACREFLQSMGYKDADLDVLLAQLSHRLEIQPEFPHEIGIFLGYPLRDVIGFIENRGRNFTCCGFWKSYGDPAEMRRCFACYRRCIQNCVTLFEQGVPLEALAVSA